MEYRFEEYTWAEHSYIALQYNPTHRGNLANVIVEDITSKILLWGFYREHCCVVKSLAVHNVLFDTTLKIT